MSHNVAMTATATSQMRSQIMKKLEINDKTANTIYQLSDRQKITYLIKNATDLLETSSGC